MNMLKLAFFSMAFLSTTIVTAQTENFCAQSAQQAKAMLDPVYAASRTQVLQQITQHPAAQQKSTGSRTIYTIPVVFHVLHNGTSGNISYAQIKDALRILNRDFRARNPDTTAVHADFKQLISDVEVEFAFATKAPDGTCFTGVTRTDSPMAIDGSSGEAQIAAIVAGNDVYQGEWPTINYLNIYVCLSLIDGAAGYTFWPAGTQSMYYDGIFILQDYCGSIGTSTAQKSRALTHEVGHWLNLSHTWGDGGLGECGDDHVDDTPETRGSSSCTLNENFCGPRANVQNYMDYSYCSKMFTYGQTARMHQALDEAATDRGNLFTAENLEAVGAVPGLPVYYQDNDGDGFGNSAASQISCTPLVGYVLVGGDCKDNNPDVNPNAVDIPGNGLDDNCDGIVDGTLGMEDQLLSNILLYPNPAKSQVNVKLPESAGDFNLTLLSCDGKVVSTQTATAGETTLSIAELAPGTYFVRVTGDDESVLLRLIKE